ncbi:Lrp/AsnC family transcriptional regulator [Pantoea coffeiphila]|uniref:Lrp/AsnC family transcriptional regulator n=1 Tax=Pantoea coffeiphila TaxID=1465635 RepID=UPI001961AA41|nr:Lrp/AsnC family transcriptional regulator [Pantoea coffeiphila]MBM7345043.1 Lrp/AsnC family leucine-responsive transcriptional regulator [Pantoea coffeiphila]
MIDRLDAKILDVLQRNSKVTSDELGEMIGLSSTGVQRRIKKLREQGVIESEVVIVSPELIGRPVQVLVSVTLERGHIDIVDSFKKIIKSTPEIMSGFYITGDADFVLIISAKTIGDYESFTKTFFHKNSHVKSFKTMVVMDRVKTGFTLPIT